MNIITIDPECKNKSLELVQSAPPEPSEHEVLIEVAYAGVNRPDIAQRYGHYKPPPGASPHMGLEVSGRIVGLGSAVCDWQIGDFVCALTNGGGYADYTVAPAKQCLPIPKGLSLLQAASLPETYFTVWSNVFMAGGFQRGDKVLVHGACSGIGVAAIQLITELGGEVYTTAGSPSRCEFAEALGAVSAIDRSRFDFAQELETHCPEGIDITLDIVGGEYLNKHVKLAAPEGRIISIAGIGGFSAEVNLWSVMQKRLTITGSTLRPRTELFKASVAQVLKKEVWPLFETQGLKAVIDSQYPLEQVEQAHQRMQSGEHIGKIMLVVNAELEGWC